jgi:hypothetical protein
MAKKIPEIYQHIAIIILVTLMAIGANLPDEISKGLGINKNYLLIGLIAIVTVSLVRYLKFTLILVIAILAVGANLPESIASELGVSTQVMFFALVAMVVVSFMNFVLHLPKGVKPIKQINSAHGARALCQAAYKGHASMVYSLISAGINPNYSDERGNVPLVVAASQGRALVVKLLLDNGADVNVKDGSGKTAMQAAAEGGFNQTVVLLKNAELKSLGGGAATPAAG